MRENPMYVVILSSIVFFALIFQIVRFLVRSFVLVRAIRYGYLKWPGYDAEGNQIKTRQCVVIWKTPGLLFWEYIKGIAVLLIIAVLFGISVLGFVEELLFLNTSLFSIAVVIILLFFAFFETYCVNRMKSQIDLVLDRLAAYDERLLTKSERYHNIAFPSLVGKSGARSYSSSPVILVIRIALALIFFAVWFAGYRFWFGVSIVGALQDLEQSSILSVFLYSILFLGLILAGRFFGFHVVPEHPSKFSTFVSYIIFAIFSAILAGIWSDMNGYDFRGGFVSGASQAALVIFAGVIGGLFWVSITKSRNSMNSKYSKMSRLRYWFGAAAVSGIVTLGIVLSNYTGILSYFFFDTISSIVGSLLYWVAEIVTSSGFERVFDLASLETTLHSLSGFGPIAQSGKIATLFTAGAMIGATRSIMIGLAIPRRQVG